MPSKLLPARSQKPAKARKGTYLGVGRSFTRKATVVALGALLAGGAHAAAITWVGGTSDVNDGTNWNPPQLGLFYGRGICQWRRSDASDG